MRGKADPNERQRISRFLSKSNNMAASGSGGGQRRLSTASNAALNQLASFELTLGGLESDVARISLSLSSDAGDDELGPLRADIAATHGAVEKLQMNNLDSVMTGHLVSGKVDAKGARKSLTQRAEALVSQLVTLNGAAANAAAAAAFAAANPASGAATAPPAAPATAVAPALLPLNDGRGAIPQVGLGTFQATAAGEVKAAVKAAVEAGYRLIDCAAGYGNQREVGEAIAELVGAGVVAREELFVVSKLFQTHHAWEGDESRCHATLEQTLDELGLEYLDLYLIHWPFGFAESVLEKPLGTKQPLRLPDGSPNPIWTIKMEYLSTWRVLEQMQAAGKTRSIGVSNFTVAQLEHLMAETTVPPAVNQVELHPYFQQPEMVAFCAGHGIKVMGFSPLGSSADRAPPEHGTTLLKHPAVLAIAGEAGRSAGQVLIRYGIQRYPDSLVSIPKSSNAGRIAANFDVFGWELTEAQMAALEALDCGFRYFISYLKRPDNERLWHEGVIEGADSGL